MSHSHGAKGVAHVPGKTRRLWIVLLLNLGITAAELVGGIVSGSLALLADAAHNFSDGASVLVSIIAWHIAKRPPNAKHSFGYGRAETVGALINLTTLLVIGLYLLYEAGSRLFNPQPGELAGKTMLIVGAIALVEDLLAAWVLRKDLGSLNVKSTYLHMIADALATVGVIVAGVVVLVWGSGVAWIDPAVTGLIALYIFWHGGREMRETISVLIDSAPDGFDHDGLLTTLEASPSVVSVSAVRVWRREEDQVALQARLTLRERDFARATEIKEEIKGVLADKFDVCQATLEIELVDVLDPDHSTPSAEDEAKAG